MNKNKSYCVYTTLMGGYEKLNEQMVSKESNIDFLCFTDDISLQSETWQIIQVKPLFPFDLIRSARAIKIASHRYLPPEYDTSLYIDNSVSLLVTPEIILQDLKSEKYDLHFIRHSFRETVLDEFEEVLRINYDKPNVIIEQLNAYSMIDPEHFSMKPIWTGFMVRNHNKQGVINMMEDWMAQVMRYSRRDQLSLNYVIRKHKLQINVLEIDNQLSSYHRWPTAIRYGTPVLDTSLSETIEHNLRIEAMTNKIKNMSEDFEELEIELSEKELIINQLSTSLVDSEQKIQARDQSIQQLSNVLNERDQSIQQLTSELAERDQSIQQLSNVLNERDQSIQQLSNVLNERDQSIQQLSSDLAERDQAVQWLMANLAEKDPEILFYALSKSWRITRPLRKFMKLLRRIISA